MRPSEDFLSESRRRLQGEISRQSRVPLPRQRFRLIPFPGLPVLRAAFTLLLVFGFLLMSTGVAAAAALPGDWLYPLKLEIEETRLLFAPGAAQQATLRVRFARARLDEIDALVAEERYLPIPLALENYHYQVRSVKALLLRVADVDHKQARQLATSLVLTFQAAERVLNSLPSTLPAAVDAAVARSRGIVAAEMDGVLADFQLGAGNAEDVFPPGEAGDEGGTTLELPPATGEASPVMSATSAPDRTNTPATTPAPESSSTLRASKTPQPTKTPRPTNTPRPSNTSKPTKTPKPTHTPRPTQENPGQGNSSGNDGANNANSNSNNGKSQGKGNGNGKGKGLDK